MKESYDTLEIGFRGEDAAAEWLVEAGYMVLERNWRSTHYELDIIAERNDVLHFVEVKTRRAGSLTPPEAAITEQKFRSLTRAAKHYLTTNDWQGEVQFDLIAVEMQYGGGMVVRMVENAMEHNW